MFRIHSLFLLSDFRISYTFCCCLNFSLDTTQVCDDVSSCGGCCNWAVLVIPFISTYFVLKILMQGISKMVQPYRRDTSFSNNITKKMFTFSNITSFYHENNICVFRRFTLYLHDVKSQNIAHIIIFQHCSLNAIIRHRAVSTSI